jgi:hypothetical protein
LFSERFCGIEPVEENKFSRNNKIIKKCRFAVGKKVFSPFSYRFTKKHQNQVIRKILPVLIFHPAVENN